MFLNRSLLSRVYSLRSRYSGPSVAASDSCNGVLTEFKNLNRQLGPDFGRFIASTTSAESVVIQTSTLASDFRLLVSIRDELRAKGLAPNTISLLNAGISRISFQFRKASANDSGVADFFDVAGWLNA